MSTNSLDQAAVSSAGDTLSQASSQNELVEENLRLQQQLQRQSAEVARSHEELHLCKRKIEQLSSQFADAEETPREVDLFADENMEEILETIDTLRVRVEQLQFHCESLAQEKAAVEQKMIDREKHFQVTNSKLQEEINFLRKTNLQLLSSQENTNGSNNTTDVPSWVQSALDAECVRKEIQAAQKKVDSLQITVLEKDKYITSLEWQLVDSDATIATLQAERDRLTMELDCSVVQDHLSSVQGSLEALTAMADHPVEDHYEYDLNQHSFDPEGFRRRVKKQPRRHLSDLTRRDFSEIEDVRTLNQKTSIRSLSDVDVPRHTDAESFALGRLKRSTNFSNINALDESEKFQLDDSMNLATGSLASGSLCDDSSMENVANLSVGKGLVKGKWQSFGSDSESGPLKARDSQQSHSPLVTSNSLNTWCSGNNLLIRGEADGTESKEGNALSGDWNVDRGASLGALLKSEVVKNDESCRSSSSAYFSAEETNEGSPDLWTFTPDSIIDVSTGEVILNGEDQIPVVKTEASASDDTNSTEVRHQDCDGNIKSDKPDNLPGLKTETGWANFERSTSVRSEGIPEGSSVLAFHQKRNSEPANLERSASVNDGYKDRKARLDDPKKQPVLLEEYQKWKVTGRKGNPPAKLKISQC